MIKNRIIPKKLYEKKAFFHNDNFPIAIVRQDPHPEVIKHKHQFSELIVVTKGCAIHLIDNKKYPVAAGDVFVITGNRDHQYLELNNLCLINILYDEKDLPIDSWDTKELPGYRALFNLEPEYRQSHNFESKLRISGGDLDKAVQLIDMIDIELLGRKPGFKLYAMGGFMQLLAHLSRCYSKLETPESISLLRIAEAINYLEDNFQEDVDFDKLASIAYLSRRQFQRIFLNCMHITAQDYLINLRLDFACGLLKNSAQSITNCALDSGFKDSNYFTKIFKKRKGITPKEFRRLENKNI